MGAGQFTTEATREQAQNALQTYGKVGDLMTGGAAAQAAGTVGSANAWSGALGGVANAAQSGRRLLPGERDAQETSRYLSQSGGRGARINMALDPSISLGFRPPVIPPSQILNPVEQFGQILSLRNLMTQGQLGQLGLQTKQLELQQLQREMEGQDRINKILAARSAAAAPLQTAPAVPLLRLQHHRSPRPTHLLRPTRRSQAQRPVGR